jgi:hypothetical protein
MNKIEPYYIVTATNMMMSSSQIFKRPVPTSVLFSVLDEIATKTANNAYVLNHDAYKRGLFTGAIDVFLEQCRPFYHTSKQRYLDRKKTYNAFITVVRQICNFCKLKYTSQIKYDKSKYSIIYYIFADSP